MTKAQLASAERRPPAWLVAVKSQLRLLNWFHRLWLLMPLVIWFSYWPRLSWGANATMNFRLTIPMVYVVVLALAGLPVIWRLRRNLARDRLVWLASALVIWSILTVAWSSNLLRGLLTAGFMGLLWLVFLASYASRTQMQWLMLTLAKLLVGTAVTMGLLALGQMAAGTYIESRQSLGLCAGCVAGQFGFVRPNLFAIEPQFLGSLLLAPTLFMSYHLLKYRNRWYHWLITGLLVTVLYLTMSRGAIYALGLGIVLLWVVVHCNWRRRLSLLSLVALSGVVCLIIQGGLAAANPHIAESFGGAITKSLNHVSLGMIDWRNRDSEAAPSSPSTATPPSTVQPNDNKDNKTRPVYDGYVAESTNVRVNLSKVALTAWSKQSWWRRLLGTGMGSAGQVMAQQTGSSYQKEIVQNEYVEVLLERGLIGLVLLLITIVTVFYRLRYFRWSWAIIVAYLAQYCFFSGLPSALHVFLVTTILLTL